MFKGWSHAQRLQAHYSVCTLWRDKHSPQKSVSKEIYIECLVEETAVKIEIGECADENVIVSP